MDNESYQVTKEECERHIRGVCEGCGGKLDAIETEDNAGNPTYWVGCNHCHSFRGGIDRKYWEVARKLVESGKLLPYRHLYKSEHESTPEKLEFYYDSQTAGLSYTIKLIDEMLRTI